MLVTQQGWPVLGRNGNPIKVETSDVRIEQDGQVFDGDEQLDSLDIVKFPANTMLEKTRNGLFKAPEGVNPVPAADCSVVQGALEEANFDMVSESWKTAQSLCDSFGFFDCYDFAFAVYGE